MLFYTNIIRYLYTFGYYLALPGLLLRLWWRSVRYHRDYRARWQERLGYIAQIESPLVIWVHAVSMGETLAAIPLVNALLTQYPAYRIVMTSTTPTGAQQVAKHLGGKVVSVHTPYDLPDCVSRFLDRIHPKLGIVMETELWPNLLTECAHRQIPMLLANARLSNRSCRGYARIAPLARQMVNSFALIAAQSVTDGNRFSALGLESQRLQVVGNIKFDIEPSADLIAAGCKLRQIWGVTRPVWVAASTHEGEEEIILAALTLVHTVAPQLLLVLAPRHPERFARVRQLCVQANYTVALRSQAEVVTATTEILLADTLGELILFYAAADIALVCGSFAPIGGHNLIEPAGLGLPVLTGPKLHNFAEISQLLFHAGGARMVTDAQTLAAAIIELLQDPQQRAQMGEKARAVVMANTGALVKHLAWIQKIVEG